MLQICQTYGCDPEIERYSEQIESYVPGSELQSHLKPGPIDQFSYAESDPRYNNLPENFCNYPYSFGRRSGFEPYDRYVKKDSGEILYDHSIPNSPQPVKAETCGQILKAQKDRILLAFKIAARCQYQFNEFNDVKKLCLEVIQGENYKESSPEGQIRISYYAALAHELLYHYYAHSDKTGIASFHFGLMKLTLMKIEGNKERKEALAREGFSLIKDASLEDMDDTDLYTPDQFAQFGLKRKEALQSHKDRLLAEAKKHLSKSIFLKTFF